MVSSNYCYPVFRGENAMETNKNSGAPLSRLVLFLICLGLLGTIIGGGYYLAVELPAREGSGLQPPDNAANLMCKNCLFNCNYDPNPFECRSHCDLMC